MKTLKNWTLQKQSSHHVELLVDGQHTLCLYVLEENLFRVLLKRKGELALAFSQKVGDHSLALRLEYRIKQLTKRQKERLVAGDGSFETLLEGLRSD